MLNAFNRARDLAAQGLYWIPTNAIGLALIALAILVLPVAPLDAGATAIVGKSLLLGTIAVVGWVALVGANLAADLYLLRFRLDTDDNLLARKHITQVRIFERAVDTLVVVIATGF